MSNARSRLDVYGRVPSEMLYDPSISPIAKLVFAALDHDPTSSTPDLAMGIGVEPAVISQACEELHTAGWIS